MPNKYEREIEEILRNMERSEPKASLGQRLRRRSDPRLRSRGRSLPSLHFSASEWLLLIALFCAIAAGGWAFAHQGDFMGTNVVTGGLAVISAICLLLVCILPFTSQSRFPRQSNSYGNVTRMRRNPLSGLSTRWNLFLLKLRYRRRKDQ